MKTSLLCFIIPWAGLPMSLHAATLTGSHALFTGTAALPSATGSDWAYFTTNPPVAGAPTNTSSSGSGLFTVSTLGPGATSLLGSGTNIDTFALAFTNGTSPLSSSGVNVSGIRNNLTGAAAEGNGIRMSLAAQPGPSQIRLWTYLFTADATLNVYAYDPSGEDPGTVIHTQSISAGITTTKSAHQFVFDYVPTGTNDALRFEYVMDTNRRTTANIGFAGISVTPVPEPGVLPVAAVAVLGCGLLRRRRLEKHARTSEKHHTEVSAAP
ncbi:hypothetical protein OVA24_16310 [Luteolibacter sp. SL250]|uniref:hypothetical protein n=1 Tax=Luteolibacter sp. SL250 TaxID=2995170 RepID=UPI0022704391|nr:hypothetical protein [Luteolibacter sp. SL250]WAC18794.1 hypothetical protein OVA24_16310 [Luteolibacter sp. SL250]